jgi:F420-non-reducing hydrogenase large subunit
MSVDKAARGVIKDGKVDDGILNLIEMAFRAYDPCHGCATHALPGQMPLIVRIYDQHYNLKQEIRRDR